MFSDLAIFLRNPVSPDVREELRLPPRKAEWLGALRTAIRELRPEDWQTFGQRWDSHLEIGYRARVGELVFEVGSVQGWSDGSLPYAEYFWRVGAVDCADTYLVSVSGSAIAQTLFDSLCSGTRRFPSPTAW